MRLRWKTSGPLSKKQGRRLIRLLKRLVGRILSQQLDRDKPLWELWFVEGLEDGRFAVIATHACIMPAVEIGEDSLVAAAALYIADAGEAEVPALTSEVYGRALGRIGRDFGTASRMVRAVEAELPH